MLSKSLVFKMETILKELKEFVPDNLLMVEDQSEAKENPHYAICIKTPPLGGVDFIIEAQEDRVVVSCSFLSKGIEVMEFIDTVRKQFPDFLVGSYFHHSHKTGEILYGEQAKEEYFELIQGVVQMEPESFLNDLDQLIEDNKPKGQLVPFPKKPKGDDPTFN